MLDLLLQASNWRSRVLVVSGEPGIGKSALLDFAVANATGLQVRQVRAAEAERGLPFAGLSALLRPWQSEINKLPSVQAAALKGALALGPAVGGDRFAVAVATLGLLTARAERQPILLAIDDFHWMDNASAEAVLFAARRLDCEGIAVLIGTRTPRAEWDTLELEGLDAVAAAELMVRYRGQPVVAEVAEQLVRDTGGNPLALKELAGLLDTDELAGRVALPVPLRVGKATTALFTPRLSVVDPAGRAALLLAALTDTDLDIVSRAANRLGLPVDAVTGLDRDGLVGVEKGRLVFAHPLVRSAIAEVATPTQLRAAHGALAEAMTGPTHTDHRAWHLAKSVVGKHEDIAAELEQMADGMRDKRAYQAASRSYERAADLAVDRVRNARCRFQAVASAWSAGQFERARDLIAEVAVDELDSISRADAQYALGSIELFIGRPERAQRLLTDSAAHYRNSAVDIAVRRQLDAALAASIGNHFVAVADLAMEATAWGSANRALTALCKLLAGVAVLAQDDPCSGAKLIVDAVTTPELLRGQGLDNQHAVHAAHELVRVGYPMAAKRILDPLIDGLRANAELGLLPYALHVAAVAEVRCGQLNAAYASASESTKLGQETGNPLWHYRGLAVLAFVQAMRGDEADCRTSAAGARRLGERLGATSARYIDEALAALEFALGNTATALELVGKVAYFGNCTSTMLLTWPGAMDIAETYARGDQPLPLALVPALERTLAEDIAVELPGQVAGLTKLRAMLSEDLDEANGLFDLALSQYTAAELYLDAARTQLSWGERLRRNGRLTPARSRLRAAYSSLKTIGARLWSERALAELRATGVKHLPPADRPAHPLTPQEMQVARAVASGATNREAASSLFLSTKTVEMHLTQIYRKLGIRSRTELARRSEIQ